MTDYISEFKNLGDEFFNRRFNIPIYQRLYVWKKNQVQTLIDDLVRAYEHNSYHEYYLGGIVVVENGECFDLIDGQQRFTTLKILREILGEKSLNLDFQIRENVWEQYNSNDDIDDADIIRMREAKIELEAGLKKRIDQNNDKFLAYLKDYVKLVVTTVPHESDLNKLFELINGRGEQLQQHEILKAQILSGIQNDKYQYGKIWDMCSNMEDFLEINIKKSLGVSWSGHKFNEDFSNLFKRIGSKISKGTSKGLKISNIVEPQRNLENLEIENSTINEDELGIQYLSIISFEMFLLYALVSFEKVKYFECIHENIEFKDKNLIQIFDIVLLNSVEQKRDLIFEEFIEHLFNTRTKFDNFIIKNHKEIDDNTNEAHHKISKVIKYTGRKNISGKVEDLKDSNALSLLQSMLYHAHTRNTQEWIIPFLKYIDINASIDETLNLLKNIDNYLYSQVDIESTILKRAYDFNVNEEISINFEKIVTYLKTNKIDSYHNISHYWFYKMDWIIWYLMNNKDEEFKFTARNSLEHISPRNPQEANIDIDKVSKEYLNSFGNLFLISGSQNSSVNNEGFKTKINKFVIDKKVKNLKIFLIKDEKEWGDNGVKQHFKKCIELLDKYFQCPDHTKRKN